MVAGATSYSYIEAIIDLNSSTGLSSDGQPLMVCLKHRQNMITMGKPSMHAITIAMTDT
jgi:hypothetical protein